MTEENIRRTRQEVLTEQFYRFEKRGRGWAVWPYAVDLEPYFEPFFFHGAESRVIDDGRRKTFVSSFRDRLFGRSAVPASAPPQFDVIDERPAAAPLPDEIVEIAISLPADCEVDPLVMERLLESIVCVDEPLAFEVIGRLHTVTIQLACSKRASPHVRQQLSAYFPEAVLREAEDFLSSLWDTDGEAMVVDSGLSREFMLPIRIVSKLGVDPLIAITAALSGLEWREIGVFQVLFQPIRNPWPESIMRAVDDGSGHCFFSDAPDLLKSAKDKISRPLVAAVIRTAAKSSSSERAVEIVQNLAASLNQFRDPVGNELIPLTNDRYPNDLHGAALLRRCSFRSGMLLNLAELVSFVHLPSSSVKSEKLERDASKTRAAPALALQNGVVLGYNVHRGKRNTVSFNAEQRLRHTYVIGASGTGKSTLLLNLIIQDIQLGNGFCVLDPHGDLIDNIIGHIPDERMDDVILLDPSDDQFPIAFNMLSAHSELEKTVLSSDLVSVFKRLSSSWGDQMTSVLGNAIVAFLESRRGGTLADLRRFLVEADFREEVLDTVQDPEVVYYWRREFAFLTGRPQAPLLTRLDTFLRPKTIRYMVSQKRNALDFRSIMDNKKILLCKLAQGGIGEENSYLLGTLIVSKFHQTALGRQNIVTSERQPFILYIDEFQHFMTPSMANILSGARKFGLGLVLAHQELRQLWNEDAEIANSVIANPYTRVCFRLGDFDAQKLKEGFRSFDAKDLQSLGTGEAIVRMERAEYDFNLKTEPVPVIPAAEVHERATRIIANSRKKYGRPRRQIEGELAASHGQVQKSAAKGGSNGNGQRQKAMKEPGPQPQPDVLQLSKSGNGHTGNGHGGSETKE